MSVQIFPSTLPGIDIIEHRAPAWGTLIQESVSGKETRVARRLNPRRTWEIQFNFARTSTGFPEMQQLEAFFNARSGSFDSFLFTASDDSSVTGQTIGAGDSTARSFQLVRSFGGYSEPIYAPNTVSAVYVAAVVQSSTTYTVGAWESTSPGVVTFSTFAPAAAAAITADFSYYFPVRFTNDTLQIDRLVSKIWEIKKVSFMQII